MVKKGNEIGVVSRGFHRVDGPDLHTETTAARAWKDDRMTISTVPVDFQATDVCHGRQGNL